MGSTGDFNQDTLAWLSRQQLRSLTSLQRPIGTEKPYAPIFELIPQDASLMPAARSFVS